MDKLTTMEASLESRLPAPLLCVTLCQPYQSWWQWCASHCLCTGSTPSALKGTSQGKGRRHVDVKLYFVCLCHIAVLEFLSCSRISYCQIVYTKV